MGGVRPRRPVGRFIAVLQLQVVAQSAPFAVVPRRRIGRRRLRCRPSRGRHARLGGNAGCLPAGTDAALRQGRGAGVVSRESRSGFQCWEGRGGGDRVPPLVMVGEVGVAVGSSSTRLARSR
jgi:hypothetical protein